MRRAAQPALPLSACGLLLVAAGCQLRAGDPAPEGLEVRRAALDFDTGDLTGTLLWNGDAIDQREATGLFAFEEGGVATWINASSFTLTHLVPGAHTVGLFGNSCWHQPGNRIGQASFTITAGATIDAPFDLTGTAGRVTGSVQIDGAPLQTARIEILEGNSCSQDAYTDDAGVFSRILAPATYDALVWGPVGIVTTFTFTTVAGQTVDLGDITIATGGAQGTIVWNGQAIGDRDALDLFAFEPGAISTWLSGNILALRPLAPGSHTVGLFGNSCTHQPVAKLGETTFSVTAGTTTTTAFDLTPAAGRLTGLLRLNGAPLRNARVQIQAPNACDQNAYTDDAGGFSRMLAPATYEAQVWNAAGVVMAFAFTVAAGQTTDIGELDNLAGDAHGTITWNGQPIAERDATSLLAYEPGAVATWIYSSNYLLHGLVPGPHTVGLYGNSCTHQPANKIGETSFTVVEGATITAPLDLTATAGRLTGSIRVNGAPLLDARIEIHASNACTQNAYSDTAGTFSRILGPESYVASIWGPAGIIGSFTFNTLAGRTTDVDSVTTPHGTRVKTELEGGVAAVGGLSLEFAEVLSGGNTTVVASGFGPSPPTGFQIMGSRYWDINTTAVHTGPIFVCIHYDQNEVLGSEDVLRLVHDDGSGWAAITTSTCKSNACYAGTDPCQPCGPVATICGTADSLSPFAIVEPLAAPDSTGPVFGPAPDVSAFATSTSGAIVNYAQPAAIDDVDGVAAVICLPATGTLFPPGKTIVTCTAGDAGGNHTAASFVVWVRYEAPTDGTFFLKPIRSDGSSVFRIGRSLGVKFRLTGVSKGITNLSARFEVTNLSSAVRGTADDECDEDEEDEGMLFKYRPGKQLYAYRWRTRGETRGTYRLRADLGDGVVHDIDVSLKVAR